MSDRILFRRPDGTHGQAVLAECEAWVNPREHWGVPASPAPCLYREPGGEYFRKLSISDLTMAGVNCLGPIPERYNTVGTAIAENAVRSLVHFPADKPVASPTEPPGRMNSPPEPRPWPLAHGQRSCGGVSMRVPPSS